MWDFVLETKDGCHCRTNISIRLNGKMNKSLFSQNQLHVPANFVEPLLQIKDYWLVLYKAYTPHRISGVYN